MLEEKEIRESIFEKVRDIYNLRRTEENFIAGESKIGYAGRVFD